MAPIDTRAWDALPAECERSSTSGQRGGPALVDLSSSNSARLALEIADRLLDPLWPAAHQIDPETSGAAPADAAGLRRLRARGDRSCLHRWRRNSGTEVGDLGRRSAGGDDRRIRVGGGPRRVGGQRLDGRAISGKLRSKIRTVVMAVRGVGSLPPAETGARRTGPPRSVGSLRRAASSSRSRGASEGVAEDVGALRQTETKPARAAAAARSISQHGPRP